MEFSESGSLKLPEDIRKLFRDAISCIEEKDVDRFGDTMETLDQIVQNNKSPEEVTLVYSLLKIFSSHKYTAEKDSDYPLSLVSTDLKLIKDINAPINKQTLNEAFGVLALRGLENEIRFITESHVIDPFALDEQLKTVDSIRDLLPSNWNEQAKSMIEGFYRQTFEWEEEHLESLSHIDGKPWEFFTDEGEVFDNINAICDRWSRYGDTAAISKQKNELIETLPKAAAPNFVSLIGEHLQEILISLEKTEVNENTWKDLWQDLHAVKYSIEAMWRAKEFLSQDDKERFANDMNTLQSYSSVISTKKLLPLIKLSPQAKAKDKEGLIKIKNDWKEWLKEGGKLESEINSFISAL